MWERDLFSPAEVSTAVCLSGANCASGHCLHAATASALGLKTEDRFASEMCLVWDKSISLAFFCCFVLICIQLRSRTLKEEMCL